MVIFSMNFSDPYHRFQGHGIFDAEYMASSVSDTRCARFSASAELLVISYWLLLSRLC